MWGYPGIALILSLSVSCERDEPDGSGGASAVSNSSSTGGASGVTACVDKGPFESAECLAAIAATCNSRDAELECTSSKPMPEEFEGEYQRFYCVWAKVVKFQDPASCTVESVEWRCVADFKQDFVAYVDPCEPAGPTDFSHWSAIPTQRELIWSLYGGPVGPWSAIGTAPGYVGVCLDNVSPPAPQPICSCTDVACAAN